jgi:hypothetical protein
MRTAAEFLMDACTRAACEGAEFAAIWDSILRTHELVASPPIQTFDDDERPHLDVRLRNGFWLRYCARSNDFSLRRATLHRSF